MKPLLRIALTLLAVSAVGPAPARATITPEARRVVDRYLEAAGGSAAFHTIRSQRIEAHISALGFQGTTTTYAEPPNRRASRTQLGPFQIPEGFDGTTGWRIDPSGKLLVLDTKELDDARASAYFENLMWLEPDQAGGSVTKVGPERDSAGTYTVLEITPPNGRPRRYWFTDRTGRGECDTMNRDQQAVVGTLSDYRRVDVRMMPYKTVVQILDLPANDLTIEVDSVIVNGPIDPAVFRAPDAEASRLTWLKTP